MTSRLTKVAPMAETLTRRKWLGRLLYVLVSLLILFAHLIPLETVPPSFGGVTLEPIPRQSTGAGPAGGEMIDPSRWFAPDLLIVIALAWVVRRPSFVPAVAIAFVFLLSDMLLQRPPGLWAGLVLVLTEVLRNRSRSMRTLPFWLEWATVSFGLSVITLAYWFTLSLVLVPQASLGLTLAQLALTIAVYPMVVLVSYAFFGVRRAAPGEVDVLGHRL